MYDKENDPSYKIVTSYDILEALRKNGFQLIAGSYFLYETENKDTFKGDKYQSDADLNLIGGCAIGQIAINLEVDADSLYAELEGLSEDIIMENDDYARSMKEIAEIFEERIEKIRPIYVQKETYTNAVRMVDTKS